MTIFKKIIFLLVFFLISCSSKDSSQNEIDESKDFIDSLSGKSVVISANEQLGDLEVKFIEQGLVDISKIDPEIKVELKYSTTDNFFGQDVYGDLDKAYFQPDVAERLKNVNQLLQLENPDLRLLIFDGVRPLSVQYILWNALDSIPADQRKAFVADPLEGSIHNYGCAVDLTIFDIKKDTALDMGTKYDYFGDLAYPRKESMMLNIGKLTSKQINNREMLRNIMNKAGFSPITSEWWHFNCASLNNAKRNYKIIQ